MRVLITGLAGFIGFHITKKLLKEGYTVFGIDNFNNYYDISLKYARVEQLGITSSDLVKDEIITSHTFPLLNCTYSDVSNNVLIDKFFALAKPDVVCHLAAQAGVRYSLENPRAYADTNLMGYFNVLNAARESGVKHFIYASSSSVYGLNEKFPLEETDPVDHPVSLYAATKRSNELMAHAYSHLYGMPTTGLRFFTVYGPWGRPDMALIKFTKAIYEGSVISLYNQGNMMRDFTYIDDVIAALIAIIKKPFDQGLSINRSASSPDTSSAPFEIYNIGNASPVKMLDYIQALEQAIGKKANIELLPNELCELTTTWADTTKLAEKYHVVPGTPLEVGIKHFIEWYKSYYKVG
ncbi:MAG: NAD-dependent epimerase/dehydratase family protein [Sediminibacterium sp.]